MSSYFDAGSTSPTLSSRMRVLGVENSKVEKSLSRELSRIETEKKNRMRELNQATNHFLVMKTRRSSSTRSTDCSPDRSSPSSLGSNGDRHLSRSPSPVPKSPLDDLRPLSPRSQKIAYRRSSSTEEEGSLSPRRISPASSPESQRRMLPKRTGNSPNLQRFHSITDASITQVAPVSLYPNTKHAKSTQQKSPRSKLTQINTGIPTIVVSDATTRPKLPPIKVYEDNSSREPRHQSQNQNQTSPKKDSPLRPDGKGKHGSLHVPPRRLRSNSVPNIIPPIHLLRTADKERKSSMTEEHNAPPSKVRGRSNSVCVPYFDHLKDAPRRNSLLRKYIAKPKAFYRTSRTIERLISDLAKGICHGDFGEEMADYKPVTPEEWEKLKLCRYLRMPSKDENVTGNTLNLDEIFS